MLLLFLCALALPASAEPDAELHISVAEITAHGVFEARVRSRNRSLSRSNPGADTVEDVRFTDFTTTIPGKLGVNFGFHYELNSSPRGAKLPVKSIIRFPEPGLIAPGGRVYKESVERKNANIGQGYPNLHGYGFDEAWEIVPGEWQFEIWYGNARLIRKTFTVVPVTNTET